MTAQGTASWNRGVLSVVLVLVLLFIVQYAQSARGHIAFKRSVIDTSKTPSQMKEIKRSIRSNEPQVKKQYVIQLKSLDGNTKHAVQTILGVSLDIYVPENSFIVLVEPSKIAQLNEAEHVSWVGPVQGNYKHGFNFNSLEKKLSAVNHKRSTTTSSSDDTCARIQLHVSLLPISDTSLTAEKVKQFIQLPTGPSTTELGIVIEGDRHMLVTTCMHVMKQVIERLSLLEQVHWIEYKMPITLSNYAASKIVQGSSSSSSSSSSSTGSASYNLPIFQQGILGDGEIVAVGDTGVDHDHCFFSDATHGPFKQFNQVVTNHRKLRGYYQISVTDPTSGKVIGQTDTQDEVDGHGTHVAGSITGSLQFPANDTNGLHFYQGSAPNSKLCFIDLHSPSVGLTVPADLYSQYFAKSYECGARIHSNSWGCSVAALFNCVYDCACTWAQDIAQIGVKKGDSVTDDFCEETFGVKHCCEFCNQYNNYASDVDRFLHDHKDMVILFAAGNSGFISKTGSITSPATSKNIIAVGASHTLHDNFIKGVDYTDFEMVLPILGFKSISECCASSTYQLACCPQKIREAMQADATYFTEKQLASFSSRGPTSDNRIKPEIVAPGYSVMSAHSDGKIDSFQCAYPQPLPKLNNGAALFSNRGTSMATPIASGATALLRQYVRQVLNITEPQGALIKAMIVHTAQPMTGLVRLNGRNTQEMSLMYGSSSNIAWQYSDTINNKKFKYPNPFNGYGLVQLNQLLFNQHVDTHAYNKRSVKLDVTTSGLTTRGNDDKVSVFKYTSAAAAAADNKLPPFRVTMSWYDPPSSPIASGKVLINDLHLDVYVAPMTKSDSTSTTSTALVWTRYTGNSGSTGATAQDNDDTTDYDQANPLEQVSLNMNAILTRSKEQLQADLTGIMVMVIVRAPIIAKGTAQEYSMVITTPHGFEKLSQAEADKIPVPTMFEPSSWTLFKRWLASFSLSSLIYPALVLMGIAACGICASLVAIRRFQIYRQRSNEYQLSQVVRETHVELPEDDSMQQQDEDHQQQGSGSATYYR